MSVMPFLCSCVKARMIFSYLLTQSGQAGNREFEMLFASRSACIVVQLVLRSWTCSTIVYVISLELGHDSTTTTLRDNASIGVPRIRRMYNRSRVKSRVRRRGELRRGTLGSH